MASSAQFAAAETYCEVMTRGLFQCSACRRQTSPIAGTIFASTNLPLRLWFRAMYHLTQSKQGISSIELGRRLGVTQTTAWKMKHKLAQVMMERDASKRLSGRVELDDAYLGGERSGGKRGRGAPGETPFVAAVETTPEGKPVRLKLRRVTSFCSRSLSTFAKRSLDPACEVVSDGLACFGAVADAGCSHQVVKTGSGAAAARTPTFKWVNTALGNIKAAIVGTYRAIGPEARAALSGRASSTVSIGDTISPRCCPTIALRGLLCGPSRNALPAAQSYPKCMPERVRTSARESWLRMGTQ